MVQRSILARIFAPALLALAALSTSATAETSKELLSASIDEVPAYLETLKALVLTESGSRDADGLAAVADQLEMHLTELGFTTERHPSTAADGAGADTVVGVKFGTGRQKVLLMAHMDTVYEKGILETEPYREDGNLIYGPGIVDAKGGIAMILHALRVLDRIGWDDYKTDYSEFSEHYGPDFFPQKANWLMVGPTGPRRLRGGPSPPVSGRCCGPPAYWVPWPSSAPS